jgi:YidC/Oxa1 family membrane protein insertase
MEIIISIFNEVLYRPLFNALIYLYQVLPVADLGIAIVILTVIIRLILYPLSKKAIRSQKALSELQPKMKEIQQKHKDNKEEQSKAMMDLYKKHKVNPVAGCLPILFQIPILIALYRVFLTGVNSEKMEALYSFIAQPETINFMFLGFLDLSERSIGLAVLVGLAQFVQSKMMLPQKSNTQKKKGNMDFSTMMNQQMTYFMPFISVFVAWSLPAALPLYWLVNTVFGIGQQHFTKK